MSIHPRLVPNYVKTEGSFEEIQFFSNNSLYARGLGYYFDQFPRSPAQLTKLGKPSSLIGSLLFEKSATYFDSPLAPYRLRALSPGAKIILILKNPLVRAHSWYQVCFLRLFSICHEMYKSIINTCDTTLNYARSLFVYFDCTSSVLQIYF